MKATYTSCQERDCREFLSWLSGLWTQVGTMRMQVWSLVSLSGLRFWCYCELWCRLEAKLGSCLTEAVVQTSSCNSDLTSSLGASICCRCTRKREGKKKANYMKHACTDKTGQPMISERWEAKTKSVSPPAAPAAALRGVQVQGEGRGIGVLQPVWVEQLGAQVGTGWKSSLQEHERGDSTGRDPQRRAESPWVTSGWAPMDVWGGGQGATWD